MSTNDRRGFLRQLAGFTAAAPIAALPVVALAAVREENPMLVALAATLDRAQAAYRIAAARRAEALAAYNARLPEIPDELIIADWREQRVFRTEYEKDYDGKLVGPSGHWRNIASTHDLQQLVEVTDGRTRIGKLARKRLRLAKAYDAEKEVLERSTGVEERSSELHTISWALRDVVTPIMEAEARTMAGLALKARAMIALSATDTMKSFGPGAQWGREFAENILVVERAHV